MSTRTAPRLALAAMLAASLVASLVACVKPMSISQVRQRATELEGKQVVVEGQVAQGVALPLLRDHYYKLDDGTDQIWVQTTQPVPNEGQHVRVTGTLGPGLKMPSVEVGLVIVESQRH